MTSVLAHRGPDGEGLDLVNHQHARIGFGHRRLAILDLSSDSNQPMRYKDYLLCFNGEIYNFREIRKELESLGHAFQTSGDTEMILHAYEQWGEKALDKFIGMFALIILDERNKEIFAARDRAGVKPFFYYWKDGLFLFASELKSFHEHSGFEKRLNPHAVGAFLQYGNVPNPHCIFEYCAKLSPGYYLKISLENEEIESHQYWNVYDAYNKPKLELSYAEAMTQTESIMQSAFDYRMVSDVPVGVFLSGGFDSTSVAALLQKKRSEKLKTFTIGVPDIGLNEAPYAKDIAHHLGTDHTEIHCTEKEALELIETLPFHYDEPFGDSSAIPTMLVSVAARKQVTVALSADAGDEIFAGYNRYDYMARYGRKLNRMPGFVRKSIAGIMNVIPSQSLPVLKNKYNFHNRYEKLKVVLKDPSNQNIMLSLSQQWTDTQMKKIMSESMNQLGTGYLSNELSADTYSPLAYMMAIDYQTYLLDDILQKVDRATMSVGLEGREPFLDHRIIEYAARLPDAYKYQNGVKKRILRDITYQYVPKSLLDRPKMGFAIPIANWLMNELKPLVDAHLNEESFAKHGLINWSEVEKIKSQFYRGKKEYDSKIWYLLMFQMWYEKWGNS